MSTHNPPPWAGSKVSPIQAFNRSLGQAIVDASNALVVELFGTREQKAALRAWVERRRGRELPRAGEPNTFEQDMQEIRDLGRRERQAALAWFERECVR